jgi:hypothetical protein
MVDEEHIGVNAIMGSKKRKGAGGEGGDAAAPAAKEPKVRGQGKRAVSGHCQQKQCRNMQEETVACRTGSVV